MSKIARVKFIRDKEPNIKALTAENKVLDGALYVATDTGTLWMGISSSSLIQIKDNINTNTTYNLTKSGNTITLRGSDGSTFNVTDSNTVYGNATASAAGLMSAADKAKLDGVAAGSNHVAVDAELSTTSTNPVQNKVIKSALDGKSNTGHKHVKADITDFPTSMPASDVPAWAKAATKPSYSKAEVGLGNVDNTADSAKSVKYAASAGSATTAATANALKVTELNTQNLNDIKTVGLYFASGPNGVTNKPTVVDAFGLEVKKTASGHLVQVLTEDNTNAMKTWIRHFNSSAWSAWAHYFDSNHTPTWSQVSNKPSFATVATSGSYNDLSNKPTIPTIPGSLKNPNALTISLNGTSQGAYDGSAVKNINITASSVGAAASSHTHTKAQITDFPTSMPASDVYSWAKAATKPSYSKAEVGLGNVDNTADSAKSVKYAASAGSATTAATANALKVTELNTQNLNDIKTVGLYFASGPNGVTNKPTVVDAFGLEVKKTASGHLVQVLTEDNTNAMKTWIRHFNSSAWSAWAHYFDSNHTPTWSQVSNKPSFATVATSGSYNDLSNKPTIPTIPGSLKNPNALTISLNGTSQGAYDGSAVKNINITASSVGAAASSHTHTKAQITDFPTSMPASDVYSWAKRSSKPSYTISEVSGNLPASRISGTIAAANLPSYVDDVLEYASLSKFPTTGESGKIYTALDTNKIYRWSGSAYVVISETVALGTTHSSAGYGDESRAAYNHSTKTSGNPHHVTKADVGLGNVDNTADSAKSVKYATSAGSAGSVAWSNISDKPSTYAPSSHTHDDRYYTESEMNTKLAAKAASDVVTISSTKPSSNTCKLWIKI